MAKITCVNCNSESVAHKNTFTFDEYGLTGKGFVEVYECLDCRTLMIVALEDATDERNQEP